MARPAPVRPVLDVPKFPRFPPASFAQWMAEVLQFEGISQVAAARQLGVSIETVGR